jgi:phosphoribosyl 1,2-cyclic phosphodiesterase
LKFCSLYSGSSGNSLFVSCRQTKLLIDAGMSGIKIQNAMKTIEEDPKSLKGILVTHEHRDHIHGIGVLSRRFDLPVYATQKTWEAMDECLGKISEGNRKTFDPGKDLVIEELQISPFKTSHDAAQSCGFVIDDGIKRIGIATDTGVVTDDMLLALKGCSLSVVESNHALGMLEAGAYPFYLKQRIKSEYGHLSNEVAGNLVKTLVENGGQTIVLAHLSQENNFPLLAFETTSRILQESGIDPQKDIHLSVAKRSSVSEIIEL